MHSNKGKRTSAENESWKTAENGGWKMTDKSLENTDVVDVVLFINVLFQWKTADRLWKMAENLFVHWKIADNFI